MRFFFTLLFGMIIGSSVFALDIGDTLWTAKILPGKPAGTMDRDLRAFVSDDGEVEIYFSGSLKVVEFCSRDLFGMGIAPWSYETSPDSIRVLADQKLVMVLTGDEKVLEARSEKGEVIMTLVRIPDVGFDLTTGMISPLVGGSDVGKVANSHLAVGVNWDRLYANLGMRFNSGRQDFNQDRYQTKALRSGSSDLYTGEFPSFVNLDLGYNFLRWGLREANLGLTSGVAFRASAGSWSLSPTYTPTSGGQPFTISPKAVGVFIRTPMALRKALVGIPCYLDFRLGTMYWVERIAASAISVDFSFDVGLAL